MKVNFSEPDMYKQEHPIESDELIAAKLEELDLELDKIPDKEKETYLQAMEKCPELISKKEKIQFLRCEVFNADLAAQRMVAYWEKRLEIFGPEKAFLPLTLEGAMKEESVALHIGLSRALPTSSDPGGRRCLFYDPSRQDKTKYTRTSMLRVLWYMIHKGLEDDTTQKRGLILIAYPQKAKLSQLDRNLMKNSMGSIRGCIPVRLSAIHLCHPPSFFQIVFPLIKLFMGERLRRRINIHGGTQEHVLDRLENKFGLKRDTLPTEIGGSVVLDHDAWIATQRELEASK